MRTIPQPTPALVAADIASLCVVDVREADEITAGGFGGGIHIPLGQLSARLGELSGSMPIATVCQSGRRNQRAAEVLAAAGFAVANLDGGINRWIAHGLPTA
jgi:rhodanese-related sulfurtransferase